MEMKDKYFTGTGRYTSLVIERPVNKHKTFEIMPRNVPYISIVFNVIHFPRNNYTLKLSAIEKVYVATRVIVTRNERRKVYGPHILFKKDNKLMNIILLNSFYPF